MRRIALAWRWLCIRLRDRNAELRLCVRMTAAAVLNLAVAHLLNLPIALWTVLTAVNPDANERRQVAQGDHGL